MIFTRHDITLGMVVLLGLLIVTPLARAQVDSTTATRAGGAPVVFAGDTLFFIQARAGSFLPAERAKAIAERMQKLSKDPLAHLDSVTVVETRVTTEIFAGDVIIMAVTEPDAMAAGQTRQQLAGIYSRQIQAALKKASQSTNLKSLSLGVLFTLVATAVLFLLFKILNKIFPRLYARLGELRETRIPSLKIQEFEILSADRITETLTGLAKALRVAMVLVLLYFYLPLVLSFFPWTRGLATTLFGYVVSPFKLVGQAFLSYLPNLFFIAVISIVTYYATKFIHLIFTEIGKGSITIRGFHRDWAEPTFKIARFLIIAFAIIMVFPYLPGSDSPAFRGVSVFLGILFSLGSASAISNVVAGVVLTYTRAFNLGNRVKIGDTTGNVVEKTLLATRIRTPHNVEVTIPNAMVLGSHITNFSALAQERGLILNTTITIGYDAPWRKVHELLIAAARSTPNILPAPAPFVLQKSLDDFYVSYELNAYTNAPDLMAKIYSELHQNIQDQFNGAGLQIMSPHYVSQPDAAVMPAEYIRKT